MSNLETPISGREACKIVGCCYETLLQMCKSGTIPHFRIGNRYWFRAGSLDQWLTRQEKLNISDKLINKCIAYYGKVV